MCGCGTCTHMYAHVQYLFTHTLYILYIRACVHVLCVHVLFPLSTGTYVRTYVCMHMCVRIYVHVCLLVCVRTYVHTSLIHKYVHTHLLSVQSTKFILKLRENHIGNLDKARKNAGLEELQSETIVS